MVLYENFNTTNQTSPHFEKHENYVSAIELPTCAIVSTLPYGERCAYVEQTAECHKDVFVVDYVNLLYCKIDGDSIYATMFSMIFLLFVCLALFIVLGLTADGFFCPSLTVVSRLLGLNENVAGVTLLAFGNGAPDIFTNLASMSHKSERLFSNSYSSVLFVSLIVAGSIVTFVPFVAQPENFLRDILFLFLSIVYIDYCIKHDNSISLSELIIYLCIYILYICVVIVDQMLIKRRANLLTRRKRTGQRMSTAEMSQLKELKSQISLEPQRKTSRTSLYPIWDEDNFRSHTSTKILFKQLLNSINAFDINEWARSNWVWRIFIMIKVPIQTLLFIMIPVVELEGGNQGWSKLLNCLQIILMPCVICYGTVGDIEVFPNIKILYIVLVITIPTSILLLIYTNTKSPPKYHKLLSTLSIVGSIFVVYAVAEEITNILKVIGIITSLSGSFIGCTLLACGNSIGDLVADLSLARQGYQKMAFAACFGGPLFNSVICISIGMIYKTSSLPNYTTAFGEGSMGENASIFLISGLFMILLAAISTNFVLRRSIGILMLFMYSMFFCYSFLGELNIIHTYGTDHSMDLRVEEN